MVNPFFSLQAVSSILDNPVEPVNSDTFFDCLDKVTHRSQVSMNQLHCYSDVLNSVFLKFLGRLRARGWDLLGINIVSSEKISWYFLGQQVAHFAGFQFLKGTHLTCGQVCTFFGFWLLEEYNIQLCEHTLLVDGHRNGSCLSVGLFFDSL